MSTNAKILLGLVIGTGLGLGIGHFVPSMNKPAAEMAMNHTMPGMAQDDSLAPMVHAHPMVEVDQNKPLPSVSIEVLKDIKDGYNIRLMTKNFAFTPEKVNMTPVQGEGHAHIYINDVKIGRLYGEWFHIGSDKLKAGQNTLEVTLNTNDHGDWAYEGQHIADKKILVK